MAEVIPNEIALGNVVCRWAGAYDSIITFIFVLHTQSYSKLILWKLKWFLFETFIKHTINC